MARSKSLPDHVTTVGTYEELAKFARAFADGHLNLLMLLGDPGLGKSRHVREAVGHDVCWIDGTASPFGIYTAAYEHRDRPLILDDIDGLYGDRAGVRLLKSLCQTEPVKTLAWHTRTPALERHNVPRQFTTRSLVAIIANQWKSLGADVAALEDRGHVIHFDPTAAEVHAQAATWFWDQEIFDFVAEHLHLTGRHSLRAYQRAWELKSAGMNWKAGVLSRCLSGTALCVAELKADPSFPTEEDRVRAFVEAGLGCRATYFNRAKALRPVQAVPRIVLTQSGPPAPPRPLDLPGLLRERYGRLGNG